MKKITQLLIALLFSGTSAWAQSKPCKEVIAYYCDWISNSVDYSKYTIINYAFVQPNADGSINDGNSQMITNLVTTAHQKGVKVMLSIGGWTWSNNFPTIAASAQARSKFASQCLSYINKYKLDGVDIDWEYPGYVDHGGTPADKVNFTLLMQAIRASIGTKLLSSCFGAATQRMDNIEWDKVPAIVDMINMMTYDFAGSWDKIAYHNSPLYASDGGDLTLNIDTVFKTLTTKYNVPSSKINIGAAFYGHGLTGVTALFGPITGGDGDPTYTAILAKKNSYTEYWDNKAKVPYLLNTNTGKYITYDNEQSMTLKGQYVVDNKARGVIIWEISGDRVSGGNPLATALIKGLCSTPNGLNEETKQDAFFYPCPTTGSVSCFIKNGDDKNQVSVFNGLGQLVISQHFDQNAFSLSLSELDSGIYIVNIVNGNGVITKKIVKE